MRSTMVPVLLAAAALSLAAPTGAATVKGVDLADSVTIGGRECRLNGVGVRTKIVISVYLGALYLETPTRDAAAAVASDEPKRTVLHFVHSKVEAGKIREAWREGFAANAGAALPQLTARLRRRYAVAPGVRGLVTRLRLKQRARVPSEPPRTRLRADRRLRASSLRDAPAASDVRVKDDSSAPPGLRTAERA